MAGTSVFYTESGTGVIGATFSADTIENDVDYTLPAGCDETNSFIRLANSHHFGIGRNDGNTDQTLEEFGVHIPNNNNISTSVSPEREGTSPTYNCEYRWDLLCYTGPSGGANEFIVRATGVASGTGQTVTGPTVTTIENVNDCVVFITGVGHTSTGAATMASGQFTSSLVVNGSDYDPTFTRGEATNNGTAYVSYAVVEFVGSNWTVDRITTSNDGSGITVWGTANNNYDNWAHGVTISSINKACIIEHQFACDDNTASNLQTGEAFMLYDDTNIRFQRRGATSTHTYVLYILQNSQNDADARNFNVGHYQYRDDSINISDPRTITPNFTTDPDMAVNQGAATAPTDEISLVCSMSMDGTGGWYPRNIDYWLVNTNAWSYKVGNDDEERRIALEVIEWPEDPPSLNVIVAPRARWGGYG